MYYFVAQGPYPDPPSRVSPGLGSVAPEAPEALVDVLFVSKAAACTFSEPRRLQSAYEIGVAEVISRRLQQLLAAPTLEHMRSLPGRCRPLPGSDPNLYTVDVTPTHRLVLRAEHPSTNRESPPDWNDIERITVIEVSTGPEGELT